MANTPFKLKSGNTSSFKMMGSSPAKHPLERKHTHPKEKKEEGPVKGPEDTDVMNVIKKNKQSGPQDSKENKQKEIDKLVEERDPTAGKGKSVAKPKKKKRELEEPYIDKEGRTVDGKKPPVWDGKPMEPVEKSEEEKRKEKIRKRSREYTVPKEKLPHEKIKDFLIKPIKDVFNL